MTNCIFCKIISGQLPSEKVYEDNDVLAILDIKPVRPGHTLVITKTHTENFIGAPVEITDKILSAAQKVAKAVVAATQAQGFNLSTNNGRAAGQIIDHLHFHIIPRREDDRLKPWSHHEYNAGEMQEVGKTIREKM